MVETLDAVRETIDRASLASRVHILGHVPDQDMAALYGSARGVILPTFFGPTNIPILEAWSFDVPVLTSDIRGIREQCGDAAILVDPTSVDSIAAGIASLWSDEAERSRLVKAGRERLAMWRPADFVRRLGTIVDEVSERVVKDRHRSAPSLS